ncbi:hypothetical protein EDB19DRAFT_1668994 [Suillus lakei]|nr:hypothetical protein EDB19DRAFT_1668994 [Suillus lakei]
MSQFGGTNWAISPLDMNLGTLNDTTICNVNTTSYMCAGGIFGIGVGSLSTPAWICCGTFLKNVNSIFRASPTVVDFAQLASVLSSSTRPSDPN